MTIVSRREFLALSAGGVAGVSRPCALDKGQRTAVSPARRFP